MGAGAAGLASAYFLSRYGVPEVVVFDSEPDLGMGASSKSAQMLIEFDRDPVIERLKIDGGNFLREPDWIEVTPREPLMETGALWMMNEQEWCTAGSDLDRLTELGVLNDAVPAEDLPRLVPVVKPDEFGGAILLPASGFVDVNLLFDTFEAYCENEGIEFRCQETVRSISVLSDDRFELDLGDAKATADVVVNAAGARAAEVVKGLPAVDVGLVSYRRSICVYEQSPSVGHVGGWPIVWSAPHNVYFRMTNGGVMLSPMEEVESPPGPVEPDEALFHEAIARLTQFAPALKPRHDEFRRTWAGLRTFTRDRHPVVGPDPRIRGLVWAAGLGGCGIEACPAIGRAVADYVVNGDTEAIDKKALDPARFRLRLV